MFQVYKRAVLTIGVLAFAHVTSAQAVKVDTSFTPFVSPAPDGSIGTPTEVTQGPGGMLYAISSYSSGSIVAIFQINPVTHTNTVLATIDVGQTDPQPSRLVLAGGHFFASFISDQGGGILRYDPGAKSGTVVRQFLADASTGLPGPDGIFPGPLTLGHDGMLYGGMELTNTDVFESGSLFRFDPGTYSFATIHQFDATLDGAYPVDALVEGASGVWYGTNSDQLTGCGTAFKFDTATGTLTTLHTFDVTAEGCFPGELAFLPSGLLIGVTTAGTASIDFTIPTNTTGGVFTLDPVSGTVAQLHMFFVSDPLSPIMPGNILVSATGNAYVVGNNYGAGVASVLRVHPDSGAVDDIADLTGPVPSIGAMIVGNDARLYGVFESYQLFALGVLDPLPVAPAGGLSGGTTTLSTTLKALGIPLPGRLITFSINGINVGSQMTDANGIATLNNVSLVGIAAGTYPDAVGASFSGDALFPAQTGSGLLSVLAAATPGLMVGDGFINQNQLRYSFKFLVSENVNGVDRGALELRVKTIDDGHKKTTAPRNDRFVSTSYTNVVFALDPASPPQYDTAAFSGTGTWNGQTGYTFSAFALDRLGPSRHSESFQITVYDPSNNVVASVNAVLSGGSMKSVRMHKQ